MFASTFGVDFGGYAAYKCLPEDGMIATKPANLSYEEAALFLAGRRPHCVVFERALSGADKKVLIYGASGAVGTYAVQIASTLGQR